MPGAMIGVVVNRSAGAPRRDPGLEDRLRAALGAEGHLAVTTTPDEVAPAIGDLIARGAAIIATCGGDGTNLSTLTQLATLLGEDNIPPVCFLRGGTVNTVAENLRIAGQPPAILARLVEHSRRAEPVPGIDHDLVVVNGRYGFLFAAAMGARFIEAYLEHPTLPHAAALALRTLGSSLIGGPLARHLFEPIEAGLEADGERLPIDRVRLLLASTVADVGLGMRVTWRADTEPGRFHVIASGLSTPRMALQVNRVRAGRPLLGKPHIDQLASRLTIRFTQPEVYTLDGDLFREREIAIRIGPRVRLLRP